MSNAYDGVAKRKESYLEVFFEIGNSVIKASLEKCENFTKKIQSESVSDFLSSNNGDDISEEAIQVEKQVVTKEKNRKIKKGNVSKNTRIFRLKLALCLFLILVFVSVLYAFFWLFIEKLKIFYQSIDLFFINIAHITAVNSINPVAHCQHAWSVRCDDASSSVTTVHNIAKDLSFCEYIER